jgi:UrcA family protein
MSASLVLCAALLSTTTAAAAPQHVDDTDRLTVSYADLDIGKKAGAAVLYARFKDAAEKFCGMNYIHTYRSVHFTRKARECYKATLDKFVAKVDSEIVTSLHTG